MTIDQLQPTIVNQPFAVPTAQQGYANAFQTGAAWQAPAATGYAPPAAGYAPPATGYAAPATGYAPPPTAPPPPSGYAMPAPAAVAPHTAPSGFSLSKLTPTTILVVGALVAGAWFMTHKHHTTSNTVPAPVTVPAVPPTQPVNPPSGQSGGQPNGQPNGQSGQSDQSSLLSHVPSDIASTCEATQADDGAPAVQCSAPNNITVEYAAYASGDTADGALSSLTGGLQTISANGCSSGSCSYQSTNGDQGQVVWFTATVNNAQAMGVAWSSERLGIVGLAIEQGKDNSALVKWWNKDSGPN